MLDVSLGSVVSAFGESLLLILVPLVLHGAVEGVQEVALLVGPGEGSVQVRHGVFSHST